MAYSDFDKLKAFFFELKNAKFRPEKMRSRFVMNGRWATVNKAECFDLLRKKIPDLQGKDDAFLIKYLSNPNNIKNRVLAEFVAGERIELEKSLTDKPAATEGIIYQQESSPTEQTAPVGTTTSTSAGGMPFKMPSAPPIPSVPRFPRVIVRDKDIPQITKEEAVNQPKTPTPSIASVSARTPAETKQVESTIVSPSSRRFNFPSFRSSLSSGFKKVQNLASPAGPFLKINSGRIGNGLKNMFGRTANFGGRAGLGAINHGGNFLSNLGSSRARFTSSFNGARSRLSFSSGGGKKVALAFAGAFFLILIMGAIGGMTGTTPTGEAAPIPPSSRTPGLDYTLPLKDPSIQPLDIRDQVKATFPGAKLEYWDKIVQRSKDAGFNPALTLALWIEETGASQTTLIKNGGSEIPVNGNLSKGHLGCAPWEDQTIDESLKCLFKFASNYTNDQFAQFMAAYSGGPADNPFSNNPNFPANIKTWYSKLVPSGAGAITPVSVPPPSTGGKEFTLSCPIANENNTCSHFDDPRDPCHCNPSQYLSMAACQADASLNYGIDVGTKASKTALIPYITYQGETMPQSITCQLITAQSPTQPNPQSGGELQQILHYRCSTSKTDLYLQYNHIKASASFPATVSSGQIVGDIANYGEGFRRLNIQVGVNGECAYNQTQSCKRGGDYFQCPLQKESPPDY